MNLVEKIDKINSKSINPLANGKASSLDQLYDDIIKNYMPNRNTVEGWHSLLMKLIKDNECVYAIRAFHSEKKSNYKYLRRGFLNRINKNVRFIYVDNYFTAYMKKLQLDNYVPTYDELVSMIKDRSFPIAYFHTSEEREMAAFHSGRNPGIDTAHYKIAHIVPTGEKYNVNNKIMGIAAICKKYFPKGERYDWAKTKDGYYIRDLNVDDYDTAKNILVASLLRCVHPLNTFLVPGVHHEKNNLKNKNGVGEYEDLLNYMHQLYSNEYKDIYKEFLDYAMVPNNCFTDKINQNLEIEYGFNINYSAGIKLSDEEANKLLDDYLINGLSLSALDVKYYKKGNSHGNTSYNFLRGNGISNEFKGSIKKKKFDNLYKNATGSQLEILDKYITYRKNLSI